MPCLRPAVPSPSGTFSVAMETRTPGWAGSGHFFPSLPPPCRQPHARKDSFPKEAALDGAGKEAPWPGCLASASSEGGLPKADSRCLEGRPTCAPAQQVSQHFLASEAAEGPLDPGCCSLEPPASPRRKATGLRWGGAPRVGAVCRSSWGRGMAALDSVARARPAWGSTRSSALQPPCCQRRHQGPGAWRLPDNQLCPGAQRGPL